jgi:membrane-associated phospholipid phosphatase
MRSRPLVILAACLVSAVSTGAAQTDSASPPYRERRSTLAWIIPVGIAASVALDPEAREWALHGHSRSLDHFAKSVNRLGTAQRLVPAMAITYVGAILSHHESLATGTLNTAAGYAAADLVESVLKPLIGRERPHVEGNSRRFRPFTGNGDWHSLPSAHVAHIAAIAAAVSEQTHSTPISVVSDILVALVGWDRLYEDQHWASDVAATVVLSKLVSGATVRWLRSRQARAAAPAITSATATSPAPR